MSNKEDVITFAKDTRLHIDKIINTIKIINFHKCGREAALAVTNLQLGKMWLGKTLKSIGNPNPYPESRNPANDKIDKSADSTSDLLFTALEPIQAIKFLRENLDNTIKSIFDRNYQFIEVILKNENPTNEIDTVGVSVIHLIEADMWLGMALGVIRDTQESNNIKPV